jgi:outer membrane protein TolC
MGSVLQPGVGYGAENDAAVQELSLEQCLNEALENNHRRPASQYAVEMAEAQHRQVLSAYWPQLKGVAGYSHADEAPNFIFPTTIVAISQNMAIPIPEQDVKLMDEDNYKASVDATWLLYDGGMRKGLKEQTAAAVDIMKQESRRTELEITDSVKRLYWGAVLAIELHQVGKDTLARMEATLQLTETMYKEGSGRVKKTDWLQNKVMVESLRSMVALLEKNEIMAQVALANTMGLGWNSSVRPVDKEMPYTPFAENLDGLVSDTYKFSPDWAKVEAALRAADGAMRSAKSGHYPKIAVTGEVYKWWNDYDGGLVTDANKDGWNVGIGIEIPLFSGMLTHNKIAEAKAMINRLKEEQLLLKEGLGIQVRDTFLSLNAAEKSHQATLEAMKASTENRDLNTRAYQNELVETKDVINAQIMEALMSAQHYKARYDHVALQSQLSLMVGTEIMKKI